MISLVIAMAMMAGEPAAAPASNQAANPPKAEKSMDEMVCKKESVLGSRMKQRVCLTQAQWDARRQDSRDEVERGQRARPLTF